MKAPTDLDALCVECRKSYGISAGTEYSQPTVCPDCAPKEEKKPEVVVKKKSTKKSTKKD